MQSAKSIQAMNFKVLGLFIFITFIIYANTIGYGFDYDDYHFVRPYSLSEVTHAYIGDWDESGIQVDFYRPLTISFFALRFLVFGFNYQMHHLLSILLTSIIALLLYKICLHYSKNRVFSLLSGISLLVYPYMAHSAVAWSTNQMHLLQMFIFLSAWLFMVKAESRHLYFLFLFQIAAFLIKEDGIVLLPTLIAIYFVSNIRQLNYKRFIPFVLSSALLLVLLFALRQSFLGDLGGYGTLKLMNIPKTLRIIFTLERAVRWTFLFTGYCGLFMMLLLASLYLTGLFSLFKNKSEWKIYVPLLAIGLIIILSYNMLTVFSTKLTQWHMQSLGHSLIIAVLLYNVYVYANNTIKFRWMRGLAYSYIIVMLISMAFAAYNLSKMFAPFTYQTLYHDNRILEWNIDLHPYHQKVLDAKVADPRFKHLERLQNN